MTSGIVGPMATEKRVSLLELSRALAGVVGDLRVSTKASDRTVYARDMWPRLLLGLREGKPAGHPPDVVVWPETVDEIAELVRVCRRLHVPLVPYGAGSGVAGGAVPIHGGVTIDLKRLDRVRGLDERDGIVDVEAGMNGERFERDLERRGYTLGHFPSSIYCSTVGGWLAARSAGQMSTKYGKIEDMVAGLTVVTGRGDVIQTGRLGRAGAGPDWTQLLVGSEGTLGIIASARLRVRPQPETRILRGFEFSRIASGLEGIRRVLQRGLRPAVVRLYDEFDSFMALRGKPGAEKQHEDESLPDMFDALEQIAPSRKKKLQRGALAAVLGRPRALNRAVDVASRTLWRRGCLLIVGVEGSRLRTEAEGRLVFQELARAGGKDLGEEPGVHWYKKRYAVSYRMPKMFEAGAFVDTMEVASTWERLLDLYEGVKAAIGRHAFVMAHFSHAYPEGCSIYFTFAGRAESRTAAETRYDAIWREGLAAASRAGGTISHHHGVGLMKGPHMAEEHRESFSIYEALRATFDPDGIMNPGKMGLSLRGAPWSTITQS
jgi:alkyldihydroxyacetonephosphate synthase